MWKTEKALTFRCIYAYYFFRSFEFHDLVNCHLGERVEKLNGEDLLTHSNCFHNVSYTKPLTVVYVDYYTL